MVSPRQLCFLTLICGLSACIQSFAQQDTVQTRQPHYFWLNYDSGGGNKGFIVSGGFTYQIKKVVLGVRVGYIANVAIGRKAAWEIYQYSLQAGMALPTKKGRLTLTLGPALVNGLQTYPYRSQDIIEFKRDFEIPGLYNEVTYTFISNHVGLGFGLQSLLNAERSYVGLTLSVQAGKLRDKKKH